MKNSIKREQSQTCLNSAERDNIRLIGKTRATKPYGNQVMVEGLMTFGKLETGLRTLDFECCEDVEAEPFRGEFYVQGMRDGNVYMTEHKKRIRNKAIFRDDNSSFSHGQDGKFYFVFMLDEDLLEVLPERLVSQASSIAQKVLRELCK